MKKMQMKGQISRWHPTGKPGGWASLVLLRSMTSTATNDDPAGLAEGWRQMLMSRRLAQVRNLARYAFKLEEIVSRWGLGEPAAGGSDVSPGDSAGLKPR